jgi:conjugal transfer pilus assembly protein TraF
MRYKQWLISLYLVSIPLYSSWYDTPNRSEGFYFYGPIKERIQETLKKEKYDKQVSDSSAQQKQYPNTKQMQTLKAEVEESLSKAILWPTPQNLYDYQHKQKALLERAELFSQRWLRNTYFHFDLDHTLRAPVNQLARPIYYAEQQKERQKQVQMLAKKYGLFFFFSQNCTYCHHMAPIVRRFSEQYNWSVMPINLEGTQPLPDFPNVQQDNGIADQWGVNQIPALFAVNPKTKTILPIAYGLVAIDEIERRIITLMREETA